MRNKKPYTPFSKNLMRALLVSGITQYELADALGVTHQVISCYTRGAEPCFATLVKIADFFGISVDNLLRESTATEFVAAFKQSPRGWE